MDPISARLILLMVNTIADAAVEVMSKRVQVPPETPDEIKQAITPVITQHVNSAHAAFSSMVIEQNADGSNVSFHTALSSALEHIEKGAIDIAQNIIENALGLPESAPPRSTPQLPDNVVTQEIAPPANPENQ